VIERRIAGGARMIGRKIGLTAKPMQEMLGVNEPDFGVLLDDMMVEDGDEIPLDGLLQPRIEAELAFVMERDLAGPGVNTATALEPWPACSRPSRSWTAAWPTGASSWWTPSRTTRLPALLVWAAGCGRSTRWTSG
jgi:hypothetical protein